MKFISSMESQSLKNELHKYFGYTTECPTNASFNQRRALISPDAFKDLFFSFTSRYNNNSNFHKGLLIIPQLFQLQFLSFFWICQKSFYDLNKWP